MTLKPCVVCGEPSAKSRCESHRPKDRKPSRQQRGYDAAWQELSRRARRLQPFCTDCGATEDLQSDHSPEAWQRKAAGKTIRLQDIAVVCGDCNIRRGKARGGDPSRTGQHPHAKAESRLLTRRANDPAQLREGLCRGDAHFLCSELRQILSNAAHGREEPGHLVSQVLCFFKDRVHIGVRGVGGHGSGVQVAQRLSMVFVVLRSPLSNICHLAMVA